MTKLRVGVLAVQGDVEEHVYATREACRRLGIDCEVVEVKLPKHLDQVDGIIIPGGESTTIGILCRRTGLLDALKRRIESGMPVFGTCAGMIMLAKEVVDAVVGRTGQPILGVMNISVIRNVFGRQRESFEVDLEVPDLNKVIRAVFIRAPAIVRYWGSVKPMAYVRHERYGRLVVLARENHMLASAFHPEMTKDTSVHEYFINMVVEHVKK